MSSVRKPSPSARRALRRPATWTRGFTLVELMIGLVLGIIVLFALVTLFVNNSRMRREIDQASQQIEQNQMTSAGASQQNAQRTMQRMRDEMEQSKRAQAQQLLRQLASLIESIDRLIRMQENELNSLAVARDADNFGGLDRNMIRLNQNTQAVAGEARAAGQEARRVARSLDRAADAQGAAVTALRAAPINAAGAEEAENRSLTMLKEARELAQTLEKETAEQEVQRRREELMEQYRKFAERQVSLRAETVEL